MSALTKAKLSQMFNHNTDKDLACVLDFAWFGPDGGFSEVSKSKSKFTGQNPSIWGA